VCSVTIATKDGLADGVDTDTHQWLGRGEWHASAYFAADLLTFNKRVLQWTHDEACVLVRGLRCSG
jgi:hypothetical protein